MAPTFGPLCTSLRYLTRRVTQRAPINWCRRATFRNPDARPYDWLRAGDGRLAATCEHVGAGIVEVDQDGGMLRVNSSFAG
jgi:hypothetical protein